MQRLPGIAHDYLITQRLALLIIICRLCCCRCCWCCWCRQAFNLQHCLDGPAKEHMQACNHYRDVSCCSCSQHVLTAQND